MITKEEFDKAVEYCNGDTTNCLGCPLRDKDFECGVYLTKYIKENEPAPAATGTSSEVSQKEDTASLVHLDDSTKEQICQAYDTVEKVCTNMLTIYVGMSPAEQRVFDIGEVFGEMCIAKDKLKNLRGEN